MSNGTKVVTAFVEWNRYQRPYLYVYIPITSSASTERRSRMVVSDKRLLLVMSTIAVKDARDFIGIL